MMAGVVGMVGCGEATTPDAKPIVTPVAAPTPPVPVDPPAPEPPAPDGRAVAYEMAQRLIRAERGPGHTYDFTPFEDLPSPAGDLDIRRIEDSELFKMSSRYRVRRGVTEADMTFVGILDTAATPPKWINYGEADSAVAAMADLGKFMREGD